MENLSEAQVKANWEKDESLRSEFADDFEAYKAYAMDQEGVKVKVQRGGVFRESVDPSTGGL